MASYFGEKLKNISLKNTKKKTLYEKAEKVLQNK
jgi:hypothetical protein